jgi:F-type H+-transporting ATPase subunit b
MLVDWLTVLAQAANFLLLVYLLRRFLYGPITGAIEDRRRAIEARAAQAEATLADARAREQEYRQLGSELASARQARLDEAKVAAERWGAELRDSARAEVGAMEQRWRAELRRAQDSLWQELAAALGRELHATAARVVSDLTGGTTSLQQQIQSALLAKLRVADTASMGLDPGPASAARMPHAGVAVWSAEPLEPGYQHELRQALASLLGPDLRLTFGLRPELLAGIEMHGGGWKIAWSLRDYLGRMQGWLAGHIAAATGGDAGAGDGGAGGGTGTGDGGAGGGAGTAEAPSKTGAGSNEPA